MWKIQKWDDLTLEEYEEVFVVVKYLLVRLRAQRKLLNNFDVNCDELNDL